MTDCKKENDMNERICQMWQDELVKSIKAGERFRKILARDLPERDVEPSMDGDEAISRLKAMTQSCNNEKDLEAFKIAIEAIDEVWNEW